MNRRDFLMFAVAAPAVAAAVQAAAPQPSEPEQRLPGVIVLQPGDVVQCVAAKDIHAGQELAAGCAVRGERLRVEPVCAERPFYIGDATTTVRAGELVDVMLGGGTRATDTVLRLHHLQGMLGA